MQAKKVDLDGETLVFICTYITCTFFLLLVLLWCRPHWWNNVGIHYYDKPFCKCTQCEIINMGEVDFGGVNLGWRFR